MMFVLKLTMLSLILAKLSLHELYNFWQLFLINVANICVLICDLQAVLIRVDVQYNMYNIYPTHINVENISFDCECIPVYTIWRVLMWKIMTHTAYNILHIYAFSPRISRASEIKGRLHQIFFFNLIIMNFFFEPVDRSYDRLKCTIPYMYTLGANGNNIWLGAPIKKCSRPLKCTLGDTAHRKINIWWNLPISYSFFTWMFVMEIIRLSDFVNEISTKN